MNQLAPAAPYNNEHGLSLYDRVDPLPFITSMGTAFAHSGVCGCKTPADGQVLALACLAKRCDPFEIDRRYHLMNGKLSMKADVMLAEFRARGGKHQWVKDGSDGESVLHLEYDGQKYDSKFTMAQAKAAGLVKSGSGWEKNPANMLRARATSNGVRMLAPEITAGLYTPEEQEDIANDRGNGAVMMPPVDQSKVVHVTSTAPAVATTPAKPAAADVIDVEASPVVAAVEQPAPTVTEVMGDMPAVELRILLEQAGKREQFERDTLPKLGVNAIDDIPADKANRILENLRKILSQSEVPF